MASFLLPALIGGLFGSGIKKKASSKARRARVGKKKRRVVHRRKAPKRHSGRGMTTYANVKTSPGKSKMIFLPFVPTM